MRRSLLIGLGILIVALAAYGFGFLAGRSAVIPVDSFDACAEAGYPVGESYPRQCWTPDGRHFTEIIGDGGIACTADAFQCPDGTWVGRTGPRCEFICP